MGKKRETEPTEDDKYSLPEIGEISCPICKTGSIKLNRTIHKLPDGEEILILLMECDSCTFKRNDVISLQNAFQPGVHTLYISNGDLTAKIFRSPSGFISLPEADFEIEPGSSAEYFITNVEGILSRMIHWAQVMRNQYAPNDKEFHKIQSTLKILTECMEGSKAFHLVLTDKNGGSYISSTNENALQFEPL